MARYSGNGMNTGHLNTGHMNTGHLHTGNMNTCLTYDYRTHEFLIQYLDYGCSTK